MEYSDELKRTLAKLTDFRFLSRNYKRGTVTADVYAEAILMIRKEIKMLNEQLDIKLPRFVRIDPVTPIQYVDLMETTARYAKLLNNRVCTSSGSIKDIAFTGSEFLVVLRAYLDHSKMAEVRKVYMRRKALSYDTTC